MKGDMIKSGGRQFIGLVPIEHGWWICTWFTLHGQKLYIVLEDEWIDRWAERGLPLEIYEEED